MTRVQAIDPHVTPDKRDDISRARLLTGFAIIAAISFIVRSACLHEDDGLWFTAGEDILRGKALFQQV